MKRKYIIWSLLTVCIALATCLVLSELNRNNRIKTIGQLNHQNDSLQGVIATQESSIEELELYKEIINNSLEQVKMNLLKYENYPAWCRAQAIEDAKGYEGLDAERYISTDYAEQLQKKAEEAYYNKYMREKPPCK